MGAIAGQYLIKDDANVNNITECFVKYEFDYVKDIKWNRVELFAFHQIITPESKTEILPYFDKNKSVIITADAIIDNRSYLLKELSIDNKMISDSQLILEAYHKWGENLAGHLIGDFAFVIYDAKLDKLILCRDQLGKRSLYYSIDDSRIIFSTLLESFKNHDFKINKNYLQSFLSIRINLNNVMLSETLYLNVHHVMPAEIIVYSKNRLNKRKYWSLKKSKRVKKFNSGKGAFQDVFEEAVKCRMRTSGEVGVMLSGGLDSSAVCCVAAKITDKEINTFTSIPSKKYNLDGNKYFSFDESNLVKTIGARYKNVKHNFLSFDDYNSINTIDHLLNVNEQPYKFICNGFWVDGIAEKASKNGCKVLLDGQSGNFTISYGDRDKYFLSKLLNGHWLTFYNDFNEYCSKFRLSRKKEILRLLSNTRKKVDINLTEFFNEYRHENTLTTFCIDNELKRMVSAYSPMKSMETKIAEILNPNYLNHLGEAETKIGLFYKLAKRDPTRDLRLIEFCYNSSIEMFNYKGLDRTLVMLGLSNDIPKEILDSQTNGYQSGDFLFRIEEEWPVVIKELSIAVESNHEIGNYVNKNKLMMKLSELEKFNLDFNHDKRADIQNILIVYTCYKFLDKL